MKGLILSGGKGTRLRPLTYTAAKQLVPVANKAILFYVIENLIHAGIQDLGIIISPETGVLVQEAIGNGTRWGVNVSYIVQSEPAGLAHAVSTAREFLGDEPFVMYLGDNLIGSRINGLIETFSQSQVDALILLKEVQNPCQFGIAEVDAQGCLVRLVEKPQNPTSNLALVGVYIFSPVIHEAIAGLTPSWRGELEITDAIQRLLESGRAVTSYRLDAWWLDTGKKDDLLTANTIVLDEWARRDLQGEIDDQSQISGRVSIAPGSRIINSTLRGPIVIGANCLIKDSFIGPFTSIGDHSRIESSAIEHSVILNEVHIQQIDRLEDSLIGKNARLARHEQHRCLRLMISDDSVVEF
ncbi:MAG: glucose-1-phosphate thymidylyltransferase [Desulfobacca sp. 4484_104]|nr:MAG: glucose-1-phosphate thymidylyltransferase [Desulfobacca sp. 4484_104]RLA88357.1 MAG: glucose-1-phosphate thymidylyltransferase [Deltaproteobacteria bacterium]